MIKKFLSYLSIALILNNFIFLGDVFAAIILDNQLFQIKVNDWTNYSWDIEVNPWAKLSILVSGQNDEDPITNPYFDFTFSSTNFSYDPTRLKTYVGWAIINQNIPLGTFNPWTINTLEISPTAGTGVYLDAYYTDIFVNQDTPDNILTISSTLKAWASSSATITRNVYINSNPHITDYFFEKALVPTTEIKRWWWDNIDLVMKIKDYNWCTNIDSATVTANLSSLWLWVNESLIYDSCASDIATYKRTAITTMETPVTITFDYSDFSVTDESWNTNNPNDPQTTFDDEDKKISISLDILSAWIPNVTLNLDDNYIWSITNNISNLIYSADQNWEYKLALGSDANCVWWTILTDWTTWYTASADINYILNSSSLTEWTNSIYACFRNDEALIWSTNWTITKDTTNPIITAVSANPSDITTQNPNIDFTCNEDGEYQIEKSWTWTINSGTFIWSGAVIATTWNSIGIDNALLNLDNNDIFTFCLDEAENYTSSGIVINKTIAPPTFVWEVTNFIDNDIDFDWLDWRDLFIDWNNTSWLAYSYFESYKIFILPDASVLDEVNDTPIFIDTNNNSTSFLGTAWTTNDSHGDAFISWNSYKACISLAWTNGLTWTPWCVSGITLTSDTPTHPTVTSATFTSDTNLEIITNANLDTNLANHSWSLISYTYKWSSYTWNSINSIVWQTINIDINTLSDISAIWTTLLLSTWALRADGGWFNDDLSFASITDWQNPTITGLINNTVSTYNNFYTWSINLSYTFWEDMLTGQTKIEITRVSWNADWNTYSADITLTNLLAWTNNQNVDLSSLWLIDWTTYSFRITWQDLAWNSSLSNTINASYDTSWPDIVIQDVVALYWLTLTPTLTWTTPLDNSWNWSGIGYYNLNIYTWLDCLWAINQSHTPTTNSQTLTTLWDIADYSWKLVAVDNMDNIWTSSVCNNFRVDTSIPSYSNYQIEDTTISSTSYFMNNDTIEITSTITDTDIDHIWLDISEITWNVAHNNELCSTPSATITCTYIGDIVTYSFNAWAWIIDWVKQVNFNSQNTSGWNDTTQSISITADSTDPVVNSDALTAPTWLVWSLSTPVTWTTSRITDNIGLDYISVEYSTWAWIWNLVWTWANTWTMDWDLTSIISWADYKIQLTAYDLAWNTTSYIFPIFEIDRTLPTVPSDTIISPNGWEIFGSNWSENITWNFWSITDANLLANPIELLYSTNWSTWISIVNNLANSWNYSWTHWNIDFETVTLRIQATDSVWNIATDDSDSSFIIDTTNTLLSLNFTSTPIEWSYINNSWFDILWNTSDLHFDTNSYIFQNITSWEYYNWTIFTWAIETLNNICTDPTANWIHLS